MMFTCWAMNCQEHVVRPYTLHMVQAIVQIFISLLCPMAEPHSDCQCRHRVRSALLRLQIKVAQAYGHASQAQQTLTQAARKGRNAKQTCLARALLMQKRSAATMHTASAVTHSV